MLHSEKGAYPKLPFPLCLGSKLVSVVFLNMVQISFSGQNWRLCIALVCGMG
jgi:hypothetical protein